MKKHYFAMKILLRNLRGCVWSVRRMEIGKRSFLDDVKTLEDLINIEEQGKSLTGANDTK